MLLVNINQANAQIESNEKKGDNSAVQSSPQPSKFQLNLTPEQDIPYRSIIKRYAAAIQDVRKSFLPKDEKQKKIENLQNEKEAEIKSLLSTEQFKVYLQRKEEQKTKYIDMRKK